MIQAIVATAQNLAIGRDGKLPWRYSSDLKFFKQATTNHAVVMGWNTWASIGKPLPNRLNIVLSRSHELENQRAVLLMRTREEILALRDYLKCDLFITGGASVYELFSDDIKRWIVTEIPLTVDDADTFMPQNFLDGFRVFETKILEDDLRVKIYERN